MASDRTSAENQAGRYADATVENAPCDGKCDGRRCQRRFCQLGIPFLQGIGLQQRGERPQCEAEQEGQYVIVYFFHVVGCLLIRVLFFPAGEPFAGRGYQQRCDPLGDEQGSAPFAAHHHSDGGGQRSQSRDEIECRCGAMPRRLFLFVAGKRMFFLVCHMFEL